MNDRPSRICLVVKLLDFSGWDPLWHQAVLGLSFADHRTEFGATAKLQDEWNKR